eukprot:CAMPEP_0185750802 /NCGR_PEP_ID=MMETSP1174-20130828/9560_1 /TAXON_ID=35687 /ORGANISM="Dictyocha speculum, Strain CCMP1381" /LENGTH=58 /DNA_ID=CAMNT_0028427473 /DNA_START=176 /DNA_END=352 /DNA_ORIENTATION=+
MRVFTPYPHSSVEASREKLRPTDGERGDPATMALQARDALTSDTVPHADRAVLAPREE